MLFHETGECEKHMKPISIERTVALFVYMMPAPDLTCEIPHVVLDESNVGYMVFLFFAIMSS